MPRAFGAVCASQSVRKRMQLNIKAAAWFQGFQNTSE